MVSGAVEPVSVPATEVAPVTVSEVELVAKVPLVTVRVLPTVRSSVRMLTVLPAPGLITRL